MSEYRELGSEIAKASATALPPALIAKAWRLASKEISKEDAADFLAGTIDWAADHAGLNSRFATRKIVDCAQRKARDGITEYLQRL